MALQIRLVHALADEVLELQPRSVEQPLIVGRTGQADIQVPSANAALRHCLLFVHNGRWILQDAGSPGGTLVNGTPITAPVRLNSGDVITLAGEANPPVLVIDPNHLGMPLEQPVDSADTAAAADAEQPSIGATQRPVGQPASFTRPAAPVLVPVFSRPQSPVESPDHAQTMDADAPAYGTPEVVDASYSDATGDDQAPTEAGDEQVEAGDEVVPDETLEAPAVFQEAAPTAADLAAVQYARKIPARKNGLSVMTLVITGIIALGLIIACVSIVRSKISANDEQIAKEAADRAKAAQDALAAVPTDNAGASQTNAPHPKSIFTPQPVKKPAPPREPVAVNSTPPTGTPPTAAPPPASQPIDPADDPRRQTPEWLRVENATVDPNPAQALVVFDDYLKETPKTPFKSDVDGYIDDALDRLWMNRIVELCKQRTQARKDIGDLIVKIREETDASYKKQLFASKDAAQRNIGDADDELKDFKYAGQEAPNLDDPNVLKTLRAARDPAAWEKWKKMAYHRIVTSHGTKLPWS